MLGVAKHCEERGRERPSSLPIYSIISQCVKDFLRPSRHLKLAILSRHVEARFRNIRILLVDDMQLNLMLTSRLLQKCGYAVDTADSGPKALTLLQSQSYDLIFLDCQMPGMDGFQVAKHIRADSIGCCSTPVIALTASRFSEIRQLAFESGIDDYLAKPLCRISLRSKMPIWIRKTMAVSA